MGKGCGYRIRILSGWNRSLRVILIYSLNLSLHLRGRELISTQILQIGKEGFMISIRVVLCILVATISYSFSYAYVINSEFVDPTEPADINGHRLDQVPLSILWRHVKSISKIRLCASEPDLCLRRYGSHSVHL